MNVSKEARVFAAREVESDFAEHHVARFWAKVSRLSDDECWQWAGTEGGNTYGRLFIDRHRALRAHRYSYVLHCGFIRTGMVIDHACKNRGCVNPAHLRMVTNARNVLENSDGVTARNAMKTHCASGHKLSGSNLRIGRNVGGKPRRECIECSKARTRQWRARLAADAAAIRQMIGGKA